MLSKGEIAITSSGMTTPLIASFGVYPDKWKKANVIPVHKKESENLLTNYRPISLLPVCGKIFEKYIYNSLYGYLQSNDILSKY